MWPFDRKSPERKYKRADQKLQKLYKQRENLKSYDDNFDKKSEKIENDIHKYKVERRIALEQIKNPPAQNNYYSTNVGFSSNKEEKGIHFHFHKHTNSKKSKKRK